MYLVETQNFMGKAGQSILVKKLLRVGTINQASNIE